MTTVELLSSLRRLDVKLWVEGERLRYSAPPKTLNSELIAQLAAHKTEIINLLNQARSDLAAAPPIQPVDRRQILPLSFAQQRLWILDRLTPDSSAYHIPVVLRLEGSLDVAALRQSINETVKRHEALRTVFTVTDGQPRQTILPELEIEIPLIDLSDRAAGEKEAELEKLAAENSHRSFDLSRGPLLRAIVVKLDDEDHALCVTLHHIISDGWSSGILIKEFAASYEAFSTGRTPTLLPLKVQYADFAVWQREWLEGEVKNQQLAYWKKQLGENLPVLELPAVKPRPAVQTFRGATENHQLSRTLTGSLNELSRQQNVTLFMVLLAAFQVLLSRYSRQEEIVVGTPIANRNQAEIEPLIGFFVNTLVLRGDLSGDPTFLQLLQRVRERTLEAYAHQDLPFEVLVDELQPRREVNRTPLFQVVFVLQNAPFPPLRLPRLTITLQPLDNLTAKFDLTLSARENESGLSLSLEYNTDIFDSAAIQRLLRQYETLLEGVVHNPALKISRLPLLSASERKELLVAAQASAARYPVEKTLPELFEERAAAWPGRTAIVYEGVHLTYAELDQQANRLANRLRHLGVGPESLVSICLERSEALVVALLGVLKAGAAYVPLDPATPPERLSFLLEDTRSPVLITEQPLLNRLTNHSATLLLLDADRESLATESGERPQVVISPNNLAYVIYTSGSTGKPKGTLVTHYNVTRLFQATQSWFNFNEHDVWTLFHSYAFDFSVWEIWGALLYGAKLVVPPYATSRSPAAFYELLVREQVTVLNQTPSAFQQLLQVEGSVQPSKLNLRLIIFGGEALELQSLKPWFDRHGDTRPQLVNMYGITETTVHVTYRPLKAGDLTAAPGSVIGRAIPDLQVYILDTHMQPAPLGAPGEMYVGGAGVARGYLNRPDLSAQRYVPDPFSSMPGQRLYRSGDLARNLPGGDIEYLGRVDQQVKIRGHRIELGEIEATLNQHPEVHHSVVVAKEDAATNMSRLVAYVVPNQSTTVSVDEFRRWLKRTLPDYMIPANFVTLESLPLTANGKVDYKALPEVETARPELSESYVAPRTEAEQILAEVWSEVLQLERVGINDNFFDLGGDSIRAIQVHAKATQRGLTFPLPEIFRCQTIAELAALAEKVTPAAPAPASQAFSLLSEADRARIPGGIEDAYPLAMLQTGMIFHSEYSKASTAYLNVSSIQLRAAFNREALQAALKELAQRHPILRISYDLTNFSEPLQLVHHDAEIELQIDDLRELSAAEQDEIVARWIADDQKRAFDLARAPLLRFQVHLRSDETFQLSWTEHHAILDGWSVASMMTELFQLYFSFSGEDVAPLAPPPQAMFRDFIARERETLLSEESQNYWRNKLSEHNVLALPRRATPERETTAQQLKRLFVMTAALSAALKRLASSAGVPLKSVLLAAHLKVLSVLGNQRDVLTGLVSNGRLEETDGERVLGLFLNTVPFRLQLRGGSWLELIRETFLAEQELLPFRRYPVAELQREYGGGVPLFETMFNFTHFHVYQGLREISALEILDIQSIATTNYALAADFSLDLVAGDVQLRLEYNSARLDDSDIETIGGYYLAAFEAMVSDPAAPHLAQSLLSAKERLQLRKLSAGLTRVYPATTTIHGLFEEQAARTPAAEALCGGDNHVTYAELNRRAEQLARRLQRMGVGPESRAGVLMNRAPDLVVALLGVLKAGGCYVPLDPTYPSERLNYIFNDAQISVLLTEDAHAGRLEDCAAPVVILDRPGEDHAAVRLTPVSAGNLAYIIYTSGSTGRPKGVAIEHRSAAVFLRWAQEVFGENLRGMLASTSVCFDLSIFELFAPLSCGGRVLLAENVLQLPELPQANEVTLINTVPSAIAELLRLGPLPASVTTVNLAGEALKEELVEAVYASSNVQAVYNLYGPSEDTTYSTYALVNRGRRVTIGRPVANTQVYILNESLQLAPAGAAGEIFIGGDGLARGYLNRPELTAEKFIPDPFSEKPGARLYRTGDLGRYVSTDSAEIEFLGRLDYQVKIRGFRIETGEIESVLLQHAQVRESVVHAREDAPGDKRLVAYVVPANGAPPAAASLRDHLKAKLPDYMIPSAFVTLESLPLTPNGKVNRKELPAPEVSGIEPSGACVRPRDELELRLARVWEETLGAKAIGVKDNFFDLGGNSLLAVRLMARIRQDFGERVPINALFEGATIEQLAQNLRGHTRRAPESSLIGIQTSGSRPPLFCVHPIGGSVFCYLELAKALGAEQPLYGLQAPGLHGEREPFRRLEDLASHYLEAVREVQPRGPYRLAGWSMGGVVAFEMAQQLRAQGDDAGFLALIDSAVPQSLERSGDPREEETRLLAGFLRDLGAQAGKSFPDIRERLRPLDAQARIACLLEEAEAHGILPPGVEAAQLESYLRVFRFNVQALSAYVPQRYEGRLALFRATENNSEDSLNGWSSLAKTVETYSVPGSHYTVMVQPNVQTLAGFLNSQI